MLFNCFSVNNMVQVVQTTKHARNNIRSMSEHAIHYTSMRLRLPPD